jgi:hypothetical protein
MPTAIIDGIVTRYEVIGSGPPLLMYAPSGFNAVIEAWSTLGVYQKIKLLDHLPAHFTCILFDRRECGQSGGWVELITWSHYVAQGKGLLGTCTLYAGMLPGPSSPRPGPLRSGRARASGESCRSAAPRRSRKRITLSALTGCASAIALAMTWLRSDTSKGLRRTANSSSVTLLAKPVTSTTGKSG